MIGTCSQLSIGRTPLMRANISTTTRFSPRLNSDTSTTDSGITIRGKSILRTSASLSSTHRTPPIVASWKNVNSTIAPSS